MAQQQVAPRVSAVAVSSPTVATPQSVLENLTRSLLDSLREVEVSIARNELAVAAERASGAVEGVINSAERCKLVFQAETSGSSPTVTQRSVTDARDKRRLSMVFWRLVTHLVEVRLLQHSDCKTSLVKGTTQLSKTSPEEVLPTLLARIEKATGGLDEASVPLGSRLLHLQVLRALKKHSDGCTYFEKQIVPALGVTSPGASKGNSMEIASVGLAAVELYFESCFESAVQSITTTDVKVIEKALQVAEDRAGLLLMSHSASLSQVLRPAFPVSITSVYDELLQRLQQKHSDYKASARDLVRSPTHSLAPSPTSPRNTAQIDSTTAAAVTSAPENRPAGNAAAAAAPSAAQEQGRSNSSSLVDTIRGWVQLNIPGGLPVATGLLIAILLTLFYVLKGRVLRPRLASTSAPIRRPAAATPRQLTF